MSAIAEFCAISIDCADPQRLQDFYAELLGWRKFVVYGLLAVRNEDRSVVLLLQQAEDFEFVRPVWPEQPGAQQKQLHFDFQVDDVPTAVAQAEAIGAVKAPEQYGGKDFTTMFDPEGHPFCLCRK